MFSYIINFGFRWCEYSNSCFHNKKVAMIHCCKKGDYNEKKKKRAKKKTETFTGAYWCLVTAVYLGWSLWTKQWDITYMIWPVAAVLYAAMHGIIKTVMKLDK